MIKTFQKLEKKHQITFALVIGIAVVLFWRGIWQLADQFLFPNNYLLSNVFSIIIAIIILYFSGFIMKELT